MNRYKLGLIGPDKKDLRDFRLTFSPKLKLLKEVNLRSLCPPIFDQLNFGSCVLCSAVKGLMGFNDKNDADKIITPLSVFMAYALCRIEDGNKLDDDCGTYLRTAVKCLAKYGTCREQLWPYTEKKWDAFPIQDDFDDAYLYRIFAYHRIVTMFDMKACLMAGKPFMLGIPIFESFYEAEIDGKVPMPKTREKILGYHAVYCCGYRDRIRRFTCVNSWGDSWGDKGFFTLPYDYFVEYVIPEGKGDCWTITRQLKTE